MDLRSQFAAGRRGRRHHGVRSAILRARESRPACSIGTGAALITAGLGGIVFGPHRITALRGLGSLRVVLSLIVGVALVGAFIVVEDRVFRPLVPLMLFRSRAFSGANLITLLLYAALGGALFFLPFDLIQVHHYTATAAGAAMLPLVIITALLSRTAGEVAERVGITLPLTLGPLIAAIGLATFALPGAGGSYFTTFFSWDACSSAWGWGSPSRPLRRRSSPPSMMSSKASPRG